MYKFENSPEQLDLHVDFPILTQINAPAELLITLDPSDLKAEGKANLAPYEGLDPVLREIIRENPSLPIDGQIKIVEQISANVREWYPLLAWRTFPTYDELLKPLELGWQHLLRPKESKGGALSAKQLTTMTLIYSTAKSLKGLIENQLNQNYIIQKYPDISERTDVVVAQVLQMARHWFDYKLPSFLVTVSNLQRYVFEKAGLRPGDYGAFAAQVENGFLKRSFSDLTEYGIPFSAITKIARRLGELSSVEIILATLRSDDLTRYGFTRYEMQKVVQAF